jgi:hypothetical protein
MIYILALRVISILVEVVAPEENYCKDLVLSEFDRRAAENMVYTHGEPQTRN